MEEILVKINSVLFNNKDVKEKLIGKTNRGLTGIILEKLFLTFYL